MANLGKTPGLILTNEEAEFPVVCETCLGANPYLRMTKLPHGAECVVCSKPFTQFRWNPARNLKFRKTVLCQTCAKVKHCCQSCMLDLDFELPLKVRDSILGVQQNIPKTEKNMQYFSQNIESKLSKHEPFLDTTKMDPAARAQLKKLSKAHPYASNRTTVCSFFLKGTCIRGDACPYRHEKPDAADFLRMNPRAMRERYFGETDKDFDAQELLEKAENVRVIAPDDVTITSIQLSGITEEVTKNNVNDFFYAFGEIKSVVLLPKKRLGFVNYVERDAAVRAVESCLNDVTLSGVQIKVSWGKPKQLGPKGESTTSDSSIPYPSQDPMQMGTLKK